MPKHQGGLGLRKADAVNTAFQCKLAWKVLTNDSSLWTQLMKDVYLKDKNFFDYQKKAADSPVWKNLLNCRPLLKRGITWKVGNGKSILFWLDNWIDNYSLAELLNIPISSISHPKVTVSEFMLDNHTWNLDKLTQTIADQSILAKIQGIAIPTHDIDDSFCWGLHSSGKFSTKSATWLTHDPQIPHQADWAHKWIWKIDTMLKIKVFLWQMCHTALPVRGLLLRRGLAIDPSCPLCLHDIESIEHLFLECHSIGKVWDYAVQQGWLPPGCAPDQNQTML